MSARALLVLLMAMANSGAALADGSRARLVHMTCAALGQAVAAQGSGAVLLPSYPQWNGQAEVPQALREVAFTYDNALASIALYACGKSGAAQQVADALAFATARDPDYTDGRVRNAYAAGPVKGGSVALPGYWNQARGAWSQDAYQVGSATGNQAWAALALLEAYRQSQQVRYLDAARRVLDWTRLATFDAQSPAGFTGGFYGFPPSAQAQGWKSTEHNVDLAAAWRALARLHDDPMANEQAQIARGFVEAHWDKEQGRFWIGTLPDGRTPQREKSGLDAQIWPLIALTDPPADWQRVLAFVESSHGYAEGYGFKQQPDGLWTEGTAQVAAVAQLQGQPALAQRLWGVLLAQQARDGWLYATPQGSINTGLSIGPDATSDDFLYYHLPHLGATAWAAIAATGINPFTGEYKAN
ncbi:hypothetical protein PspTeo4_12472 [Pseudomonas sp. Teo4]|nr:hypothetical protein [Pseudomonas sp. Teo4]